MSGVFDRIVRKQEMDEARQEASHDSLDEPAEQAPSDLAIDALSK